MSSVRIILPTYNRSELLAQAVASALAQTYGDFELLVIDDGSTDGTSDLLETLTRADSRVQCIRQKNAGVAAARNTGLARPGEPGFIAFLDSDDLWKPDHLEQSIRALQARPDVGLVFSRYETVDHCGKMTSVETQGRERRMDRALALAEDALPDGGSCLPREACLTALLVGEICPHTTTVVLRTPSPPLRFFDPAQEVLEDVLYFIRLAAAGYRFAFLDAVHISVRYFGDNLTRRLDLASPAMLRRTRSEYQFNRKKLAYARQATDKRSVHRQIAASAYLVGQCAAEQGDLSGARAAYRDALRYRAEWPSVKGFLGACLPPAMRRTVKRLLGREDGVGNHV